MIGNSLLIKNNKKIEKTNFEIIKDVFLKIDNLNKNDLSNFLIFKEALNWKTVLSGILKKNYDPEDITEYFSYIKSLGEKFKIKDFMSQRLYSAHLNFYYGVVVEQSIREIKRKDFEKEKNILSDKSFDKLDNEVFEFLYGNSKIKLWKDFALNFRLKNKSYYVPSKIYCNESDNFDYWLSKMRIIKCTRELNASLLSRGLQHIRGLGIYE